MAGTNLGFPYDAEIFNYSWKSTEDVYLTSMLNSGAVVYDAEIERLIANGSNFYVTPYYDLLTGTPQTYNGVNDIATETIAGGTTAGCVYGRQQGWNAKSFIKDFNSGADPMQQIVNGVANFWIKERQKRFIGILKGVFAITGDAEWELHKTNLATSTSTVGVENKMGATTIYDAIVKACGDNATDFTLTIMHSYVANQLANLQLLEYSKQTDASGITRALPLATVNGMTVVINDNVPVSDSASATGSKEYTTFILGLGSVGFATAPVDVPSEMERNASKFGGQDFIYTRIREAMHPYGFSFKGDVSTDVGIPDSVLFASGSYERKAPAKAIKMCQIVTN